MKIFCSYAFTGEDETELRNRMRLVVDTIEQLGHQAYCYHFSPVRTGPEAKPAMDEAFKRLQEHDLVLAIVSSERRSEGMLLELGAALVLGKRLVIALHQNAIGKTYLPELADGSFNWNTKEDLAEGIKQYLKPINA